MHPFQVENVLIFELQIMTILIDFNFLIWRIESKDVKMTKAILENLDLKFNQNDLIKSDSD